MNPPVERSTWFGSNAAEAALEAPTNGTAMRMWRGFMTARVAVAVSLVMLQGLALSRSAGESKWPLAICLMYLVGAAAFRLFARPQGTGRRFDLQWPFTVGIDLLVFGVLQTLQSGGVNTSPLLALPVLMASVMGTLLLALAAAAAATLILLGDAWWVTHQAGLDSADRMVQAGFTSAGYFLVAAITSQLATLLGRQEALAQRSEQAARLQIAVNELVIETLTEGVLVIDRAGTVRAANPAAMRLLGDVPWVSWTNAPLAQAPELRALLQMATVSFSLGQPQAGELAVERPGQPLLRLQARTRLTGAEEPVDGESRRGDSLCVLFLQDLLETESRLRTEKLAAMGRMSAAVAHEIRNPLAAITQANALLGEELTEPAHRRLTSMVGQNARRLSLIVEDILQVSQVQQRLPSKHQDALLLDEALLAVCQEWGQQTGSAARLQMLTEAPGTAVKFEADHLRRVLVNLLDNALRYASLRPDAIQVHTMPLANDIAELAVWSDGVPIVADMLDRLFEPFASSESRSSGLGLYICRELCGRHDASIGYRLASRAGRLGNEFFVHLQAQPHTQR